MGKRCVVYGCGNTNADGVGLFSFPNEQKQKERRLKWIKQVGAWYLIYAGIKTRLALMLIDDNYFYVSGM